MFKRYLFQNDIKQSQIYKSNLLTIHNFIAAFSKSYVHTCQPVSLC